MTSRVHPQIIARRGRLIVAVPLVFQVILLVTLAVVIRANARYQADHAREQEILASSYRLIALLGEIQASIRGYLITADAAFAEPYHRAVAVYPAELARLRSLASAREFAPIERAAAELLAFNTTNFERVRTGRHEEAFAAVRRGEGKRLMDRFRANVDALLASQHRQLAGRSEAVRRSGNLITAALAAGFVLNLVIAGGGMVFFTRGIASRVELLTENATRFEQGRPLHRMQSGDDEISQLDERFHRMAQTITASRQQLERANRELESFTYTVSHDLRAPVRALSGFARILEEDYGNALDDEGRRYLGVIRSEAERLGTLIDDLLAFSRLGKAPLRRSDVDLEELTRDVVREVCRNGAEVTIHPLPTASGDRAMLRHVLTNLIANAAKFSAPKGRTAIEVGASVDDGENTYWVRDEGVGFDMRYIDKLFGVFQRLHSETEFEGTGVGLAIVKRVIERHGGRVWAEGRPGQGATFFFTLPSAGGGEP